MIPSPSHITDAIKAEERGEKVEYGRLLRLQALETARAGERFVQAAFAREEEADGQLEASAGD